MAREWTNDVRRRMSAIANGRLVAAAARAFVLAGAAFLMTSADAEAQLTVCNKSTEDVSIAVAYQDRSGQLTSRGWYNARPGECPVVVAGPLANRYYYLRAEGGSGGAWGDNYSACTSPTRFLITGRNCETEGYDRERFFQVDTGEARAWTQNLIDAAVPTRSTDSAHQDVAAVQVGWRWSPFHEGTKVMQLHNGRGYAVSLQLKCFTNSGASKVMDVVVPARGMTEVGFVQGWPGNFVPGERCEAFDTVDRVWQVNVPVSL